MHSRGWCIGVLAERLTWSAALVCLATWPTLRMDAAHGVPYERDQHEVPRNAAPTDASEPDMSLWAPGRISAWRDALGEPAPPTVAVLRIPKINLVVPILPGTDAVTLNRAVGHIGVTARPGTDGNSGIAGHRDGYFRGLKDVGPGDAIELETAGMKEIYRVERTWVVDPTDVSVLDPTPTRSITLVTCFPFYFVGSAPQRYIVRAVRATMAPTVYRDPVNGTHRRFL